MSSGNNSNSQNQTSSANGASNLTKKSSSTPASSSTSADKPLFVPKSSYDVPTTPGSRTGLAATRGSAPKITFKPKVVPRRKREGGPESLLSIGSNGSGGNDEGPSEAHLRRAERGGRGGGRGRGRGARPEAPLMASGPFAQGPAISSVQNSKGKSSGGGRGGGRMMEPNRISTYGPTATGKKTGDKKDPGAEDELNFDDAGQPMQNLLRMRDETADFWAPVTTDRVERRLKEAKIAAPNEEAKLVKVKVEAEDLGFIDVKTEQSTSTMTSRMPSPETSQANADVAMPDAQVPDASDDEDIAMPTAPAAATAAVSTSAAAKTKPPAGKKKDIIRTMTAEEAEEQDRFSVDLESLRTNLTRSSIDENEGNLIFIQLPDILPYWQPDPDDAKNEPFVKNEDVKQEIVEIDQREVNETQKTVKKEDDNPATGGSKTKSSDPKAPSSDNVETTVISESETKPRKKKLKPVKFPPPEGTIGQLHIHRSGRITAQWGEITMDVGTGSDCSFLQEVVVLDSKTERAVWSLGRVGSRMMMAPNLDELLGKA